MKRTLTFLIAVLLCGMALGQESGSITVGGSIDTFYPVSWYDGNWSNSIPTELQLGRSYIHTNSQWRGSMIALFDFHVTAWGHSAQYINAFISGNVGTNGAKKNFVGGWQDITTSNSHRRIVIWLRGGGTTYYYHANANVSPVVYDGSQNPLPFVTSNGLSINVKSEEDDYVREMGTILQKPLTVRSGNSAIMGNLGIGTTTPDSKLAVNGNIRAKEIKLETANWPDYVFDDGYQPMTLEETKDFIAVHGHLPGLKSAKEYEEDGVNMMELNQKLLEKIEELTLHTIQQEERLQKVDKLEQELMEIKQLLLKL